MFPFDVGFLILSERQQKIFVTVLFFKWTSHNFGSLQHNVFQITILFKVYVSTIEQIRNEFTVYFLLHGMHEYLLFTLQSDEPRSKIYSITFGFRKML